jgi:dTMP kinase
VTGGRSGAFIVLEGIDGSGTTTQARLLAEALRADGHDVTTTCEPSSGPVGVLIRQALSRKLGAPGGPHAFHWSTMALLFAADRTDHVATTIEPALARGTIVISDRYDISSLAYQSVTSPDGAAVVPWIRSLNSRVPRPDLTIVLDVPPDVAAARRSARGNEAELFEAEPIQVALARVYAEAELLVPGDRLVHLDGSAATEGVARQILAAVRESGIARPELLRRT